MGWLGLLWGILKLILARNVKAVGFSLIIILGLLLRCYSQSHQLNRQSLINNQSYFRLIINADDIKRQDGWISGKASLPDHKQKVLFAGPVNDVQSQRLNLLKHQTIELFTVADIMDIEAASNFNQFDLASYYRTQLITHSLRLKSIQSIQEKSHPSIVQIIHQWRAGLITYADQLPAPLNLYFASLILGVMNNELMDEINGMKTLGLIHLFSISGFHVYFLILLLERCLLLLRLKKETMQWLLIFILPFYFVFAGASIGLLRAVLSSEIRLLTDRFRMHISGLNVWGLALMGNLILAPQSLLTMGCQLSYLLSLGLFFTHRMSFYRQTLLMNFLSVPIIIYHLYEWHLLSLAANIFILPLFSIFVMPVVIFAGLMFNLIPVISDCAANLISLLDQLVNWIGTLPGNIVFGKPTWWIVLLLIILTLLLFDSISRRLTATLLLIYMLVFLWIHFPFAGEVSYFDVGQGDSFLVREPFNRSVTLIDTGGKVTFGKRSSVQSYNAERTSINYLKSHGIHQIDNICISHQDADHCGDLPAFIKLMKVKRIYIPIGMEKNQHFMDKIKGALNQTQLISLRSGEQVMGTPLVAYHPFQPGMGENEDSMVLGATINNYNWLFTGDLDRHGELEIIQHYPQLRTDVLKLGHHGSKTSSDPQFINKLRPKIAIISAGRQNRYHHPNPETLDTIKKSHLKVYNTQEDGMITYYYQNDSGYFKTKLRGIH